MGRLVCGQYPPVIIPLAQFSICEHYPSRVLQIGDNPLIFFETWTKSPCVFYNMDKNPPGQNPPTLYSSLSLGGFSGPWLPIKHYTISCASFQRLTVSVFFLNALSIITFIKIVSCRLIVTIIF